MLIRLGKFAFIVPVITSTLGLWVAVIKWIQKLVPFGPIFVLEIQLLYRLPSLSLPFHQLQQQWKHLFKKNFFFFNYWHFTVLIYSSLNFPIQFSSRWNCSQDFVIIWIIFLTFKELINLYLFSISLTPT